MYLIWYNLVTFLLINTIQCNIIVRSIGTTTIFFVFVALLSPYSWPDFFFIFVFPLLIIFIIKAKACKWRGLKKKQETFERRIYWVPLLLHRKSSNKTINLWLQGSQCTEIVVLFIVVFVSSYETHFNSSYRAQVIYNRIEWWASTSHSK